MFKGFGAGVLMLMLVACGAPSSRPSLPHAPPAPPAPAAPGPGHGAVYRIDSEHSQLTLLVYRAGPMASLGHNHVIVNRALGGSVTYGATAADSSFALDIPAAGFVVDDARARGEEGGEFSEDVTEEARAGTLRNMLSPALLDAAQFRAISVRSLKVEGTAVALQATLAVEVAGHSSTLVVPFSLDRSAGRITCSGALIVRQSALGLTPFSVFLGALRVQDEMRVKFKLVAIATQEPGTGSLGLNGP